LIFIGHFNDPIKLAGVGIGSMVLNMCGLAPYLGLNTGLETLVSQAMGAENFSLCGIYLQRARVMSILGFLPCLFVMLFTE
jgi:Na+-driven multidrug efflux pump